MNARLQTAQGITLSSVESRAQREHVFLHIPHQHEKMGVTKLDEATKTCYQNSDSKCQIGNKCRALADAVHTQII